MPSSHSIAFDTLILLAYAFDPLILLNDDDVFIPSHNLNVHVLVEYTGVRTQLAQWYGNRSVRATTLKVQVLKAYARVRTHSVQWYGKRFRATTRAST